VAQLRSQLESQKQAEEHSHVRALQERSTQENLNSQTYDKLHNFTKEIQSTKSLLKNLEEEGARKDQNVANATVAEQILRRKAVEMSDDL